MSVVLVDAGYLFAQGSVALAGSQVGRAELHIEETEIVSALRAYAHERSGGASLLRIYWYDAPLRSGVTAQQTALANADYIKLRLGVLNGFGQQKGVDSLIVSDLIELARNRAVSDAVLVSGDEDVRVSVQVAQSLGVRIHLLGVQPARSSQSPLLRQEVDTTGEWTRDQIAMFMSVKLAVGKEHTSASLDRTLPTAGSQSQADRIAEAVAALGPIEVSNLAAYWAVRAGLPPERDRPLLARCRDSLGRDLTPDERREIRRTYEAAVRARSDFPSL